MNIELADKYWELGNAITGFAVVQMILFLSALANKEFRQHVVKRFSLVVTFSLVCSVLYALAVWLCFSAEKTLRVKLVEPELGILWVTFSARILAIAVAGGSGTGILLYGRRRGWGA
jgi:uncharacterized membrane protein YidH (DUF202 family)